MNNRHVCTFLMKYILFCSLFTAFTLPLSLQTSLISLYVGQVARKIQKAAHTEFS
jgi:hypothetical protein